MINNEFNLIGIAIGNYITDAYGNSTLKIEVEKMGSREGNVFECEVKIYGNNRMVDTSRPIIGEQVAVNGYVDFFTTKMGNRVLRLIAQRVYVLGEQRRKLEKARADMRNMPDPSSVERQEEASAPLSDLGDADLPF